MINMCLVPFNLFMFGVCFDLTVSLIRLYHTFKLNATIHFELILKLPFATYIKLLWKCLFPIKKEILTLLKAFARINNFQVSLACKWFLLWSRTYVLFLLFLTFIFHKWIISWRIIVGSISGSWLASLLSWNYNFFRIHYFVASAAFFLWILRLNVANEFLSFTTDKWRDIRDGKCSTPVSA